MADGVEDPKTKQLKQSANIDMQPKHYVIVLRIYEPVLD